VKSGGEDEEVCRVVMMNISCVLEECVNNKSCT
jgi:hypothetical protein